MATYVISDLHGLTTENLLALFEKASFGASDALYVLGDVIDRQNDGGIGVLLWLMEQKNAHFILGNHEDMLLKCRFAFDEISDQSIANLNAKKMAVLMNYMQNGGDVTLKALRALHKTSPAVVEKLFLFLRDAPLYEQIRVNNRNYILVHSGLANYASNRDIEDYTRAELLWAEPEITDRYSQSFITIFGHTPTLALKPESEGKILYTDTWFDIDVGIPYGNPPVLLRLEDHQEFR